jgi:hypothetical protein
MAEEQAKDILQFVDENRTGSFIAEAIAKRLVRGKYSNAPGIKNLIICSTGVQVDKLKRDRRELIHDIEKTAKLVRPYVEIAKTAGHNIGYICDLDNQEILDEFMEYLIGNERTKTLSSMIRFDGLIRYINSNEISNPRQTKPDILKGGSKEKNPRCVRTYALNPVSLNAAEFIYRGKIIQEKSTKQEAYTPTQLTLFENPIANVSFTKIQDYNKVIDSIRKPTENITKKFIESLK